MNTSGFLEQLLGSAKDLFDQGRERSEAASAHVEQQGIGGVKLGRFAQGVLSGGALSLLLGSRSGRRLATYGGIAALGTLAYRAMREHQHTRGSGAAALGSELQTIDRLQASAVEPHCLGILTALIAAAKADGHVDARERQLIHDELARLGPDDELQTWLDAELARPLDPAAVASAASSPELASEMYLASLLVVDERSPMERVYLDELARELKLDPDLRQGLERQLAAS